MLKIDILTMHFAFLTISNYAQYRLSSHILNNNSMTVWPTKMLTLFLCFSNNLLQDTFIIFPKNVDNFEIAPKQTNKQTRIWLFLYVLVVDIKEILKLFNNTHVLIQIFQRKPPPSSADGSWMLTSLLELALDGILDLIVCSTES